MSAEPTQSDEADALEKDITKIRHRLGNVVEELDQRRRRAFNLRLQLGRHKWALGAAVLASAAVMGGLALMRTRTRPLSRRSKVAAWVQRRLPERGRPEPRPSVPAMVLKVAVALATGAASVAGKQLTERALAHARA